MDQDTESALPQKLMVVGTPADSPPNDSTRSPKIYSTKVYILGPEVRAAGAAGVDLGTTAEPTALRPQRKMDVSVPCRCTTRSAPDNTVTRSFTRTVGTQPPARERVNLPDW